MKIKYKQEYLEDVLIRLAFNSSGIEGNTITLPQTVSIILDDMLPGGKSIREFYEVENHKRAFYYVLDEIESDQELSISLMKNIHKILTERLQDDSGMFKIHQNLIKGANFTTATPEETPLLMKQWSDNTTYQLDSTKNEEEILEIIARTHIEFERIHPFSDGNGRTGRMLIMFLSLKYLECPVLIPLEKKAEYFGYLSNQDYKSIAKLLKKSFDNERERNQGFRI